ncbi:MAG TPA: hypothetical protein VGS22_29345 [Thermoanaerobaculia bacterium]|nr:hypothetical protein [Thermoanaerobaculia bacterium]
MAFIRKSRLPAPSDREKIGIARGERGEVGHHEGRAEESCSGLRLLESLVHDRARGKRRLLEAEIGCRAKLEVVAERVFGLEHLGRDAVGREVLVNPEEEGGDRTGHQGVEIERPHQGGSSRRGCKHLRSAVLKVRVPGLLQGIRELKQVEIRDGDGGKGRRERSIRPGDRAGQRIESEMRQGDRSVESDRNDEVGALQSCFECRQICIRNVCGEKALVIHRVRAGRKNDRRGQRLECGGRRAIIRFDRENLFLDLVVRFRG